MHESPNQFYPSSDTRREELVSLLDAVVAQVQTALRDVEKPAETLVTVAHSLSNATETVARCIFDFAGSPARVFKDLVVVHDEMHSNATKATTAVQFHDRLVQCLSHVSESLASLSEFVARNGNLQTAGEWKKLQERMRGSFSMENERIVFDMIQRGATAQDVRTAIGADQNGAAGNVELF